MLLRDAARFARGNIRFANGIEQNSFLRDRRGP